MVHSVRPRQARFPAVLERAGARTPLHLATAPELEAVTGRYFEKGAEKAPSALAQDEALAKDLWTWMEQAVAT